jgi:hypothetical protein
MLRSRSRKLSQSPGASPAVHTFNHDPAKPKHSAPFTYFQINAQVVHLCPFQGVVLPDEPRYFSTVERAHPVAGNTITYSAEALSACRFKRRHSSVVAQYGVVPWEKSIHLASLSLSRLRIQSSAIVHHWGSPLALYSGSELGKSQGYSFRQISCQLKSFLRQLHASNYHLSAVCPLNLIA